MIMIHINNVEPKVVMTIHFKRLSGAAN